MSELIGKASSGKDAAEALALLSDEKKNAALESLAQSLEAQADYIIESNRLDLDQGEKNGLSSALLDRLALSKERVEEIVSGLREVISLPDPVGEVLASWSLENGLGISKVRVPIGLIGIIYEARPNVTVDASALCVKTGNAVLLRGSSSALQSNRAIVEVLREGLSKASLPVEAIQLIENTDRKVVNEMLSLKDYLDVIIPRGGAKLIDFVVNNASVPVLETGAGNCHVYLHADAAPEMARNIVVNAKTQRPSVCNAAETLLVHEQWAKDHLEDLVTALVEENVECRGCTKTQSIVPHVVVATEADWETEFLDYILAIRVVSNLDEAVKHVNQYGTRHSESIVTGEPEAAREFLSRVDAAAVYHNASTRFTDGFVFGFGAEIGISTQKLHARGPMGLPELTSYKFIIEGEGQIRE